MKLFNKFKVQKKKFWQHFDKVQKSKMAAMKIQGGALVMSQLRYDSSNRFISQHLISGVSFMSISFIVFKKRKGGGIKCPSSPGTAKKAQSE